MRHELIRWNLFVMGKVTGVACFIEAPTYRKALLTAKKIFPQYHSSRFRLERSHG